MLTSSHLHCCLFKPAALLALSSTSSAWNFRLASSFFMKVLKQLWACSTGFKNGLYGGSTRNVKRSSYGSGTTMWDAAALHRRWYHMNVIFIGEQLGRLIDEFHNKVMEHIPRYYELPKLVVYQAHFSVDRHNDVHVATAWYHFAENTLSNQGAAYHPTRENIVSTLINVDQPMIDVEACQSLTRLSSTFNCRWTIVSERNICRGIQMSCHCWRRGWYTRKSLQQLLFQCREWCGWCNFSNSFIHGISDNNIGAPPRRLVSTRPSSSQSRIMFLAVL